MTNITQQEIIEDSEKAGLFAITVRRGFTNDYIKALEEFAQLIEARLAARSDDHQSGEAVYQEYSPLINAYCDCDKATYDAARDKRTLYTAPQQAIPAIDVNKMVDRFLNWKLPSNFSPDAGISFKRDFNENTPLPMKHEPLGTNLFHAGQAKEMFEYVLAGAHVELSAAPSAPEATQTDAVKIEAETAFKALQELRHMLVEYGHDDLYMEKANDIFLPLFQLKELLK